MSIVPSLPDADAVLPAPIDRLPRRSDRERRTELAQQRRLRRDLSQAAAQEGFVLHYQPRIALRDGRIVAAEALIRWPHQKLGMMPPGAFVQVAQQSGLMTGIGGWALRAACVAAAGWGGTCKVGVNIAACQLLGQDLLRQVAEALEVSGLEPERLEIEFAEPLLLNLDLSALLALSAIRDLGVGVVLDDFGATVGSLAVLRTVPISLLKVDRVLIRTLPEDREDAALVRAAIACAHAFGIAVAAEGVETEAQRGLLVALGCDEAQGHLFGAAQPADQLRRRLAG